MTLKHILGIANKINWRYSISILFGFLFFNLSYTIISVVSKLWIYKDADQPLFSVNKIASEYLYPIIILSILTALLVFLKRIKKTISFSILTGLIVAIALQIIHLLIFAELSYLVLIRDFAGTLVLTISWITFTERYTKKIKALGDGLFLSLMTGELIGYTIQLISTGRFNFIRFAGTAILIWIMTKIFELGILLGYRIFNLEKIK